MIHTHYCNVYKNKTIEKLQGNNFPFDIKTLSLRNGFSMDIYVINANDRTVRLFFNHNFEYNSLSPIMQIMRNDPSLHFIDIGANQGFYTLPIATLGRHIVAVEAINEICAVNYASQYANQIYQHVTLVNNAISDCRKFVNMTANLYFHNNRRSSSSDIIDKGKKDQINPTVKIKQIKQVKMSILMDDLLEVIDFKKAILKMDIKGGEAKALRGGANKLFATIDIPMVLLKCNWHVKNPSRREEIITFFREQHYKPFRSVNGENSALDFSNSDTWPVNIVWKK